MTLAAQIESILFLANKPTTKKELVKATASKQEEVELALATLLTKHNQEGSGLRLQEHEEGYKFVTAPENAELIEKVFHAEMSGELTKPGLETLTIIAYRGPVSKPELELIRGVNCSLILRNLAMRGLINEQSGGDELSAKYSVSPEFLQLLGMASLKELPEYDSLHSHELLEELIKQRSATAS
jgi:segregation and condensation protein B